jgi:hypothetical protein
MHFISFGWKNVFNGGKFKKTDLNDCIRNEPVSLAITIKFVSIFFADLFFDF